MTSRLGLLARVQWTSAGRRLHQTLTNERLKVRVVMVLGGLIWLGVLGGLLAGFRSLDEFPAFKGAVVSYLLGMFFFVIMMMLFFSSTIVSYGSLFEQSESGFLLVSGVRPADIYTYRLSQAVVFSSWATLIMGLPVVIAYGVDAGARWFYYPLAFLALIPFILIPACIGGLVALLGGRFIARYKRALVAVSVVAGALMVLYFAMTVPTFAESERVYAEEWLFRILGWFTFSRRLYYPSAWMTRAIEGLTALDFRTWLIMVYALTGGALVFHQAGRLISALLFRRAFEEVGSLSVRRLSRWNRLLWGISRLIARGRRAPAALVYKDLAMFLRDPLQWGQAAIFLGLILIYFVGLRRFSTIETSRLWRLATVDLSFMSVILTISTFTTRFGFPLMSMELRAPWALSSGLHRRHILRSKVAWTGILAAGTTVALLVIGAASLGLTLPETTITAAAAAGAAFALSTSAVSLGAVFPEKGKRSPSEMVSSFGGTVTLLLSLLVVAVYITSYHLCIRAWVLKSMFIKAPPPPFRHLASAVVFLVFLGVGTGWGMLKLGERSLEKLEWT